MHQWEADAKQHQLEKPFPFALPSLDIVNAPGKNQQGDFEKRRHWCIIGVPDAGKTRWATQTFSNKRVYWRPNTKYPFELSSYNQEEVIIYDDIVPALNEFIDVANISSSENKHVYGESRFSPNYWKKGQARTIIWLLNEEALPDYTKSGDNRYAIFYSRFRQLKFDGDVEDKQFDGSDWTQVIMDPPGLNQPVIVM